MSKKSVINVDLIYPVGSLYMNVNDTDPSLLFGGEWERIKDVFLLASGDKFKIGTKGGKSEHILDYKELPGNVVGGDTIRKSWATGAWNDYSSYAYVFTTLNDQNNVLTNGTCNKAFSIMPPYLTVNMWIRIA